MHEVQQELQEQTVGPVKVKDSNRREIYQVELCPADARPWGDVLKGLVLKEYRKHAKEPGNGLY